MTDLLSALFAGPAPLSRLVAEASALLERFAGRPASRSVLLSRAEARACKGDVAGARADVDESARLLAAIGQPTDVDQVWPEPTIALATGDLGEAVKACASLLPLLTLDDDGQNRNSVRAVYARVLLDLGLDQEARAQIEPLHASAIVDQRITHRALLARLQARRGDLTAAVASIAEAEALVAPTGMAILKADVALDRAHVLLAAGRTPQAVASAEQALRRYRAKEHEVGARAALALLERASSGQ